MEKISDYLPLIIIVVSLIFTALGRKKKVQEPDHQHETVGGDIEEWEPPRAVVVTHQKVNEEKPKNRILPNTSLSQDKKFSNLSPTPVFIEPEEEGNLSFSFEEEEDLKNAIIYSEIIKRKEY